ncbi:MAG: DUF2849 domain-containing protein [Phyllobacterium sp.]
MTMKVLTANRLTDGEAVWLAADGEWREGIDGALVARHVEAVAALENAGKIAIKSNLVVDVNVIDVEERGTHLHPLRLRERIRLTGPTVRLDLGKQAGQAA